MNLLLNLVEVLGVDAINVLIYDYQNKLQEYAQLHLTFL